MTHSRFVLGAWAAVLLLAASGARAGNGVPSDPEFDGFSGSAFPAWTYQGVLPHPGEDADLCPLSDSYRIETNAQSAGALSVDCLPIDGDDIPLTLYLEIRYRSDAPVDLRVQEFTNSTCTSAGSSNPQPPVVPESAEWTSLRVEKLISTPTTRGVRLWLRTDDEEPYFAEFDRAYLGFEERIFADDFDGGSLCRWKVFDDGQPI